MGMSTDGILFWGITFEEGECPWDNETFDYDRDEWERYACQRLGFKDKSELYDVEDEVGVTLGIHCSYDYPMYYLAVKDSEQTANRGYPVDAKFEVGADWQEKMKEFCEALDIPVTNPRWILASRMG